MGLFQGPLESPPWKTFLEALKEHQSVSPRRKPKLCTALQRQKGGFSGLSLLCCFDNALRSSPIAEPLNGDPLDPLFKCNTPVLQRLCGVGLFVTHLLYPHIRRRIRLHCISGMEYRRRYAKRHPVHRSCLRPRENHQCTERQGMERQSACRGSRNPVRLENSV